MLAWIASAPVFTDISGIQLFGTNSFHTLWEAMCSDVFDNQYKKPLTSLGIELKPDFNESAMTLQDLIKKPHWQATNCQGVDAEKTLRPDYVSVLKNENGGHSHFVIMDAKYYNIELDANHVSGQPGVEDVCKQYLYQLSYDKFIRDHELTPINVFLSPSDADPEDDNTGKVIGKATMPIFACLPNDYSLEAIEVVKLSARKVMSHYIAHA